MLAALFVGAVGTASAVADPTPPRIADRPFVVQVMGEFAPAGSGTDAVSYDANLVPVGGRATIMSLSVPGWTFTALRVRGMVPHHEYGVHVHTGTCGADPLAAGPHYQHVPDPVQPSVDPAYANPDNEIWLDFQADARGDGIAFSTVRWHFDHRPARSVVLHEHATRTAPAKAGDAGARVGCVTVPFAP